jgi:hypothetical protein
MVNVPKLREVLNWISGHSELHDQGTWLRLEVTPYDNPERFKNVRYQDSRIAVLQPDENWSCGTTACLAGWTALLAGWRPISGFNDSVYRDGAVDSASGVAADILGLDVYQADALFSPDMSRAELWEYAAELTDGEIQRPPDLGDGD